MKQITVSLKATPARTYTIYIGAGALEQISELHDVRRYSNVFVITDETVKPLLGRLLASLPGKTASIVLPAGEPHKHIETVQKIWNAMHTAGCDRKSLVINLGGGVIGDIGGFAASTYMRGVDFLNVPTTLLAQVDSSVGGKTGFNFARVKNLIGTFDQPAAVIIDPQVLAGLPRRQLLAGFAEIIKHGLIRDAEYLKQVTAKPPAKFTADELADIIAGSCRIKAAVVEADEAESGERKLLNFGHSVGHAVEALSHASDSPLVHGEAISIGMAVEADISERAGLLPAGGAAEVKQLLAASGLPTTPPALPVDAILDKMRSDKKNEAGRLNLTLLRSLGEAVYNQPVDETIVTAALQAAMRPGS